MSIRRLPPDVPTAVRQEIETEAWTVTQTKSGHYRWRHPNGALVHSASTPSDHRAWANHLAVLRRTRKQRQAP